MKTTTYKCDRCGIEWAAGNVNVLHDVSFNVGPVDRWQRGETPRLKDDSRGPRLGAEWCRSCLVEVLGWRPIKNDPRPDAQPPEAPPSLEEIIRSIVRAELDERDAPTEDGRAQQT